MNDLERQYLGTAYELAMKDPRRAFHENEIAARFDLGYGPDSDEDLVATITGDLRGRGYIETDTLTDNMGRVSLRLTTAGKEEAERLADPIEQRKELRRDFLRAVYEQADGSPSEYVYWPNLAPRFGYADMQMPPRPIKVIADQLAGMGFITIEAEEGGIYCITAKGVDKVEGNKPQQPGSATYEVSGTNARININSSDYSTNTVSVQTPEVFDQLRGVLANIENGLEREAISEAIDDMESSHGTPDFLSRYQTFVSLAADHATLFAPFLPALANLLN